MPGICGVVGVGSFGRTESRLGAMVRQMAHEPFYESATHGYAPLGLRVGVQSIRGAYPLSQPFRNEGGNICLFISGEHFGDAGEAGELRRRGHRIGADGAQALVHHYEEHGDGFLERLNGCCSGLLLDTAADKAILFVDRYGLGRVYVHETGEGVWFASEAKALLAVLPECRSLDPQGVAESLTCGCVLQNRTLFHGVTILPGGSSWTFTKDGAVRRERYFSRCGWEQQSELGEAEFIEHFHDTLARRVPAYLGGGQRVGMSLTGGLDGKMIMSVLAPGNGDLPCYTFGGMFRDCRDVRLARRVARACGRSHEVLPVDRAFLDGFSGLAARSVYLSDGTMDVTGAVELYANRLAREVAPVRLTGNYGSEVVRRHVAFRPVRPAAGLLDPALMPHVEQAVDTYRREVMMDSLSFIAFRQVPWHHFSRLSIERSQLCVRSPFLDNEIVALMYRCPRSLGSSAETSLRLIAAGNAELGRIPTDRGITYPPTPVVTGLRRELEEFLAKVEYAFDYGMPQWFARSVGRVMPVRLQRRFLGRQKFYHFRTWYQRELSSFVRDLLLDPLTLSRPWFSADFLRTMVDRHLSGRGNYTIEIHRVATLEFVHRELLERNWGTR